MERKGISLLQAAQRLNIPFKVAKVVLLSRKTSRTPNARSSPTSGFSPLAVRAKLQSGD